MDINYEDVGLKVGIEIHQQLDTACKLFCNCKSRLSGKKPSAVLYRKLRPVLSEMGELDAAAKEEKERSKDFYYNIYREEACLVEMDEEPPHEVNRDALEIALKICLLLNAEIPDEIHFMRKIVIDGSNTSGFQRTAIVGMNGMLKLKDEKIGIANICLEEESCQIIRREQKKVVYGLDRLGIPLIEIGTRPEIKTPEQAKAVAEKIGMILRSTKNVKRGIGTIRQDINVSIKGGARVEIKGAQELGLIPKIIENEVARQLNLLKIRDDLRRIKFKPVKLKIFDVSDIFKNSQSLITRDKSTFAIKIERFAGFLKRKITPTRTLGNEIANYVRARTPLKGIIHSDEELGKYKLDKEFEKLASAVKAKKGDTLIIAVGEKNIVEKTMKVIVERINQLLVGVPEETRRALDNGDTEYMRPLPGAARMYPETDTLPIIVKDKDIPLPELLTDKIERYKKEYSLGDDLARDLVRLDFDFEEFVRNYKEV
ncbi:MAG TPA: Glu-tRNA(Gln) amidotransferase subunit GatE, partial [Candidatus Aenigmarchaeota archaeon]|nr:Glu-tRNA(Gln) amidotransferase subunit GatE [Candidatus Aenigmarchaeota archaeon]